MKKLLLLTLIALTGAMSLNACDRCPNNCGICQQQEKGIAPEIRESDFLMRKYKQCMRSCTIKDGKRSCEKQCNFKVKPKKRCGRSGCNLK